MSNEVIELQPAQMLTAIHNQLTIYFFDVPKVQAKNRFRELESGREIPFMGIAADDGGEVKFKLALDHSQFVGNLNFSQFRNVLASHLHRIAGKLSDKEDLNIFTQADTGDFIFHIPGIIETGDIINVLVTVVEQRTAGSVTVRLMFLNPKDLQDRANQDE